MVRKITVSTLDNRYGTKNNDTLTEYIQSKKRDIIFSFAANNQGNTSIFKNK